MKTSTDNFGRTIYHFLDYQILDHRPHDNFVLCKEGANNYETHLGNYKTIEHAQGAAVLFYMIARPERFATHLLHYVTGSDTSHGFYALKDSLKKDGMELPEQITCSEDIGMTIRIHGKHPKNIYKDEKVIYHADSEEDAEFYLRKVQKGKIGGMDGTYKTARTEERNGRWYVVVDTQVADETLIVQA